MIPLTLLDKKHIDSTYSAVMYAKKRKQMSREFHLLIGEGTVNG